MTKFTSDETLDSWFAHHPPVSPDVVEAHVIIRKEFRALAGTLSNLLPECPDKTVALRALREAMYHANACVAVQQSVYREDK